MNASTLVICRDETDPRRVRIFGTDADHLVLFSDTIPLDLLKEILTRMRYLNTTPHIAEYQRVSPFLGARHATPQGWGGRELPVEHARILKNGENAT